MALSAFLKDLRQSVMRDDVGRSANLILRALDTCAVSRASQEETVIVVLSALREYADGMAKAYDDLLARTVPGTMRLEDGTVMRLRVDLEPSDLPAAPPAQKDTCLSG